MLIYHEASPGTFHEWHGEPIQNIQYDFAIATIWSDEELATVGLFRFAAPSVPEGQHETGRVVIRDGNQPPELVVTFAAAAISPDDVWEEKDARWAGGFDYDFGDVRGIHRIATTPKDLEDWNKVSIAANAFINLGQPNQLIGIYTATSGIEKVQITAMEWQMIALAAAGFFQGAIDKAAALIATPGGIPIDYRDDQHWT